MAVPEATPGPAQAVGPSTDPPQVAPASRRNDIFRFVITLITFAMVIWVLYYSLDNVRTPTFKDPAGTIVDPFNRAGTLVAVVAPFITLVLGYWFGSKGTETANQQVAVAQKQVADANEKTDKANARATVLAAAADSTVVSGVISDNPETFGLLPTSARFANPPRLRESTSTYRSPFAISELIGSAISGPELVGLLFRLRRFSVCR